MLEQYLDGQGRSTGEDGVEQYAPADLIRFVGVCDAEGFDVHIHTIGDRAVREALDAFAFAIATNGSRDARHQIAHVEFVHDDDLPRLRTLGVISNVTPLWAHNDPYITEMTVPIVSERAARTIYRFGDIVRSGAPARVRQRLVGVDGPTRCSSWPSRSAGSPPAAIPSRWTRPRRST